MASIFSEQHAQNGRRNEGGEHVAHEVKRSAVLAQDADRDLRESVPVEHHDRKDRGQLDDVEHFPGFRVVSEKLGRQDEMAGRGNGQELCRPSTMQAGWR
jgi:hypothetical protein